MTRLCSVQGWTSYILRDVSSRRRCGEKMFTTYPVVCKIISSRKTVHSYEIRNYLVESGILSLPFHYVYYFPGPGPTREETKVVNLRKKNRITPRHNPVFRVFSLPHLPFPHQNITFKPEEHPYLCLRHVKPSSLPFAIVYRRLGEGRFLSSAPILSLLVAGCAFDCGVCFTERNLTSASQLMNS